MRIGHLVFLTLSTGAFEIASGLEICLENRAKVDAFTLQVFQSELRTITRASAREVIFTECGPRVITISLLQQPPEQETSALGGIRSTNGTLQPRIDLFTGAVAQMIGSKLPALLGRALARVATHELGHWLTDSSRHAAQGVMMERLSAAHLTANDRSLFRLPRP